VQAQSGTYLDPFLGEVLQEPLSLPPSFTALTALRRARRRDRPHVPPGRGALLRPQRDQFAYRQSRRANSKNGGQPDAQLTIGASQRYLCSYTAPVEYSATESSTRRTPRSTCTDRAAGPGTVGRRRQRRMQAWAWRGPAVESGDTPSPRRAGACSSWKTCRRDVISADAGGACIGWKIGSPISGFTNGLSI